MRVEVVDPSGQGLGLALGLQQLGHEVRYVQARRSAPVPGDLAAMQREVVDRAFGGEAFTGEADLLVLVDVFGDYLRCFEARIGDNGTAPLEHPLQADAGVQVYPSRLEHFCERAMRARRCVVLDMSDCGAHREVLFEALPGVALFAREVIGAGDGPWRPFPFLYNAAMLWLERTRDPRDWLIERAAEPRWDWVFCGTVDHARYGDDRARCATSRRAGPA